MDAIRKIEAALAAGPVEGNWHWDDDENMYPTPRNYELDMFPEAVIQTDGGYYGPDAPTRAYIAAVQPAAIREVLQTLASKEAEIQEAALKYVSLFGELQNAMEEIARLKSALNGMLTHMGMDEDEWNKPTFDQARAALRGNQ